MKDKGRKIPKEIDPVRAVAEYHDSLSRLKFEQETQRDKTLVLIAGGALTVSFAFISTFVDHHMLTQLWWLIAAWIAWGASLIFTLFGYSLSIANYKRVIDALGKGNWEAVHGPSLVGKLIEPLNIATSVTAVAGFVLFGCFVINNLEKVSNEKGQTQSAAESKKGQEESSPSRSPRGATSNGELPASAAARNPETQKEVRITNEQQQTTATTTGSATKAAETRERRDAAFPEIKLGPSAAAGSAEAK
jgi:hypothetical protein